MSDYHLKPDLSSMRAVRSMLTLGVLVVLVGVGFIVLDHNGTRLIGYLIVVVAGGLVVAAALALRKLRRLS